MAAAGLNKKIPLASSTFGVGNEQIVLSAEEANGYLLSYNYFQSLATPGNTAFLQRFHKRFGADYPNVTELACGTYQGFKLWAEGVKKAGSVDQMKVTAALESGIGIEGPSGKITIDANTHHCVLNVSLAEVQDKKFKIIQTFDQAPPSDTSAVCNLKKNPKDNQQYVIKA